MPPLSKLPAFSVTTLNDFNAYAIRPYVRISGSDYKITAINAYINSKTIIKDDVDPQGHIMVGVGLIEDNPGWEYYTGKTTLYNKNMPDLYSIMEHEIFHALGVSTNANKYKNGDKTYYFSGSTTDSLSIWDKNLRIYKGDMKSQFDSSKILTPENGMSIKISSEGTETFDIVKYSPYFAGHETLKVLSGKDDTDINMQEYIHSKGGIINNSEYYQKDEDGYPPVLGLPIHVIENNKVELSHIELNNSFMSHHAFRNWAIPMEAELAVLIDLGYNNIELRKYFGKSYYLNNISAIFDSGYGEWNGKNYSGYSTIENGIGLHIYGSNNTIQQENNTLSDGAYSIGTRIDGTNNIYNFTDNSIIDMRGKESIGILTAWGKDHIVQIDSGSTVRATGDDGIGASFDFGKNQMGAYEYEMGSYSNYENDSQKSNHNIKPDEETQGALIKNFNIAGTLEGKKAAINISENVHVANINVLNGGVINGNIISRWNSIKSGINMLVQRQDTSGNWLPVDGNNLNEIYFTNINFLGNTILNGNIDGSNEIFNTLIVNNDSGANLQYKGNELNAYTIGNNGIINFDNEDNTPIRLTLQNGTIAGTTGSLIFNDGADLSNLDYIENVVDIKNTSISLLNNAAAK